MKNYTARGFSLLEVMVVISLLMIIVSLSTVQLHFFHQATAKNELDLLRATCSMLRAQAMATGTPQKLLLDGASHSYRYGDQQHTLAAGMKIGILPAVKGPPGSATKILQSPVTFENHAILFSPDGSVNAGTIYFVSNTRLYALSNAVGRVWYMRTYFYDTHWQMLS